MWEKEGTQNGYRMAQGRGLGQCLWEDLGAESDQGQCYNVTG